ncbi:MAG: 50S ribosomal protein L17 [Spirochaetia bacterium]|nr:50S ribosomal protein L17 [Spirochaetia bacterium]
MRKRNSVKQLNRVASHRNAMMKNMVTSLFEHERVVTTRAKGKVLKSYAEKLITRAKDNLSSDVKPERVLHNKRQLLRHLRNHDIMVKLLDDIAPRYKERSGGYTRIIHLPERLSDSSKMSVVELIDRKEKVRKERKVSASKKKPVDKTDKTSDSSKSNMDQDNKKWFERFKKKK